MEQITGATELLYYLSAAFKNGIEAGFLSREHATAIFKDNLRKAGYEVPKKKEKQNEE